MCSRCGTEAEPLPARGALQPSQQRTGGSLLTLPPPFDYLPHEQLAAAERVDVRKPPSVTDIVFRPTEGLQHLLSRQRPADAPVLAALEEGEAFLGCLRVGVRCRRSALKLGDL